MKANHKQQNHLYNPKLWKGLDNILWPIYALSCHTLWQQKNKNKFVKNLIGYYFHKRIDKYSLLSIGLHFNRMDHIFIFICFSSLLSISHLNPLNLSIASLNLWTKLVKPSSIYHHLCLLLYLHCLSLNLSSLVSSSSLSLHEHEVWVEEDKNEAHGLEENDDSEAQELWRRRRWSGGGGAADSSRSSSLLASPTHHLHRSTHFAFLLSLFSRSLHLVIYL